MLRDWWNENCMKVHATITVLVATILVLICVITCSGETS